jgi:hypothetical protein
MDIINLTTFFYPYQSNGNFSLLLAFLSSAFCPSGPITSRFERRKNGMSEAECSSECTIKDDANKPKEQQAIKWSAYPALRLYQQGILEINESYLDKIHSNASHSDKINLKGKSTRGF